MSRKLVALLDYSLLPFALTILAKSLGLYVVLATYNIDWGLSEFPNSLINVTPIVYGRDLVGVSTYSNLILFVTIFVAFSFQVLISNLRQNARMNTSLLRRLLNMPQLNLLQKGWQLYTRIYVWLLYVWLVTVYILVDAALGRTAGWLAIVSFVMTSLVTLVVLSDTNKELESLKKFSNRFNLG